METMTRQASEYKDECRCGFDDCDVHEVEYVEQAKTNTLTDLLWGD